MDVTGNGVSSQQGSVFNKFEKLEDELRCLGLRVKQHEVNISSLKRQKQLVDEKILDVQVPLGSHHSANTRMSDNEDTGSKETFEEILKTENTAAALLCHLKIHHHSWASQLPWMKEVVGIVATLGRFEDDNLSSILSAYLGIENMLSIVCRTHNFVKALELYDGEGHIIDSTVLHGLGASIGRTLQGPFHVMCLDNMRPYNGDFVADDPERKLDIPKPKLINGETPPGFLGYAVNMINIAPGKLCYVTTNGLGLRETLFFNLFSHLQVYKTRDDMFQALPVIVDGAVSLDGWILKSHGVLCLGIRKDGLKFQKSPKRSIAHQTYIDNETAKKEKMWKDKILQDDIQREQIELNRALDQFEMKKHEFVQLLELYNA